MHRSNSLFHVGLPVICLLVASRTASAAPSWRCSQPDCQESLINDIEDLTAQGWRSSLVLPMPPIQATCADLDSGAVTSYSVDWSLAWQSSMRAFLLGRSTAIAGLSGSVQAVETASTSDRIHVTGATMWPDTAIDYAFAPSSSDVIEPEGDTGVSDLGNIIFTTKEGSFWRDALSIRIDMATFAWCTIASERVINDGSGTPVIIRKPFASTPAVDALAGEIRSQFHRAVRIAVGLP